MCSTVLNSEPLKLVFVRKAVFLLLVFARGLQDHKKNGN